MLLRNHLSGDEKRGSLAKKKGVGQSCDRNQNHSPKNYIKPKTG